MKQGERGRQSVVGNAVHSDLAVVVGNVLHQPVDRVVGIGGLVGGLGIVQIDPGGKVEHSLRLEASAQILDDEDVAILREFFEARRASARAVCRERRKACGETEWAADPAGPRE